MARLTGKQCRLCRREGEKLFLKGERCATPKCAIVRRSYAPGVHGEKGGRLSEYGQQLRAKQKVKRIYGLLEKQFRRYYEMAARQHGVTGEMLLRMLECRLDNVVYRTGLAASRNLARQLVGHGAMTVNKHKVTRPNFLVKPGDEISVSANKLKNKYFSALSKKLTPKSIPGWLTLDIKSLNVKVNQWPTRADVDLSVDTQLIVELYSR